MQGWLIPVERKKPAPKPTRYSGSKGDGWVWIANEMGREERKKRKDRERGVGEEMVFSTGRSGKERSRTMSTKKQPPQKKMDGELRFGATSPQEVLRQYHSVTVPVR
jgi:hypothetical protein